MWERLRRVDPLVWDTLLAVAVLLVSIGGAMAARHAPQARAPLGAADSLLLVLGCVPLVIRRRRPLAVLVTVLAAAVVYVLSASLRRQALDARSVQAR